MKTTNLLFSLRLMQKWATIGYCIIYLFIYNLGVQASLDYSMFLHSGTESLCTQLQNITRDTTHMDSCASNGFERSCVLK